MTNNEAAKWIQLDIDLAKIDPFTGEARYLNDNDKKTIEAMEMAINALTAQQEERTETHACDLIDRQAAMEEISKQQTYKMFEGEDTLYLDANDVGSVLASLPPAQPASYRQVTGKLDCISRKAAIDRINKQRKSLHPDFYEQDYIGDAAYKICAEFIERLPSAQPERKWTPCSNPPKHHKDVIVRGIEAIGNVTVHKVMQWDVNTWRPTDYAPSVMWEEWSEI